MVFLNSFVSLSILANITPLLISPFELKLGLKIKPLISLRIILILHSNISDIFSKVNFSYFSRFNKIKNCGNVDILIFCGSKYKY